MESENESGFSVLEAIVAMAVLSIALIPILSLQGQIFQTVDVVERAERRIVIQDNVVNYFKSINMDKTPSGRVVLGDAEVSWTSMRRSPARPTWLGVDDPGRFEVGLYDVKVSVENEGGLYQETFDLKAMGWTAMWPIL